MKLLVLLVVGLVLTAGCVEAGNEEILEKVELDLGASREASKTDPETVQREEEAIKLDGLNVAQLKELRDQGEKFTFQAEVNRMMKLIINSLYRNKEIFLRELISNASDALDKIRLLSLTDKSILDTEPALNIRIRADKESLALHITDTGVGMTKDELINNLGTIAKSGTAEFLSKMTQDSTEGAPKAGADMSDMIGQFGVGFYSAFLVADRVTVTTKHNNDIQYIWDSDANSFTISADPRGPTLKRGTTISLHLKPEAVDFLEPDSIKSLIKKYSQFINFPIYLWTSKIVETEEEITPEMDDSKPETATDDVTVDEAPESSELPTKKIEKTVYDWEILNDSKPIWTRKPSEITNDEYDEFYKALTKDTSGPLTKIHFLAEGEVTFKAVLFVPKSQTSDSFNKYGSKVDNIKLYVRRVFITDEFTDLMPSYLSFIRGLVDSDDLPLNVSRETLQQHKLIKVIRKKLVRKALDMLKRMLDAQGDERDAVWKEYSTNVKLGVIEDPGNRGRLGKMVLFRSSKGPAMTSLSEYVSRMKPKQDRIYYIAGSSQQEVERSPFVERLLKRGYEVLYLTEAVDEYCISALPDFEGKKFQNVAKEGFSLTEQEGGAERLERLKKSYEPLTKWLSENALKNQISRAEISERLSDSPCALVASMFGWTGNMERLAVSNAHQKADDPQRAHYLNQKKTLELNPSHPLIAHLLRRVRRDASDADAHAAARLLLHTATLRSGFIVRDAGPFADEVETMLGARLGVQERTQEEDDVELDVEELLDAGQDAGDGGEEEEEEQMEMEMDHDEL